MAKFNTLADWLKWQENFHPRVIDLGLDRAKAVFQSLNPKGIKPLSIIVAGTNGKGSCIAFLEAIYLAQGYRVGAYTSPHILEYNERIKINGIAVSDQLICQTFSRINHARNNISLSYFEFGTLTALDIFWRSNLDVQLLEVGLGGRLDAVNIIDADITLITNIYIDHVNWLGETRDAIAYEKSGIFRPDVYAVIGDTDPPPALLKCAAKTNTPLLRINYDFNYTTTALCWDWISYRVKPCKYFSLPSPSLKGEHQYKNAATVLMAATQMADLLPVTELSIHQGLQSTKLNGRFQLIDSIIPVLLDVAHNPQAVRELHTYLLHNFATKKIYAIFSMMRDKDIMGVIEIIKPIIKHWFVPPLNNPRVSSESFMQECFYKAKLTNVSFGFKDFVEAYTSAQQKAKGECLILIFGSFFLVSDYLTTITNK